MSERLLKARKAKGLSQAQVAKAIGAYQQKYQNWESGIHEPDSETLRKLADVLEVSVDWLLGSIPSIEYAQRPLGMAPLISWVQAGKLHFPIDNLPPGESEGPPIPTYCKDPKAFALRVRGDSMEPEFYEGDIIIVSPNTQWENGNYVVAKYDQEVTFKQLKVYKDALVLRPLNPQYQDVIFTGNKRSKLTIVGKVIEKIKRY